ncbi:MAG: hypothetical protein ACPL3C_08650 [Pyrobaculum sp.]
MLATNAMAMTGDGTDKPQPDWIASYAYFNWGTSTARVYQSVYWQGGLTGVGALFHLLVQINRPMAIDIDSWSWSVSTISGTLGTCVIEYVGVVYMDGDLWHTWVTDNKGTVPGAPRLYCATWPPFIFSAVVWGWATPRWEGTYIGRSMGGISGITYYATSTLRVVR